MSNPEGTKNKVFVTVRVDGDCIMLCDGDTTNFEFKANKITKIELNAGQHILEFISIYDGNVKIEKVVDYPEQGKSYLELVEGLNCVRPSQNVAARTTSRNSATYTLSVTKITDSEKAYVTMRETFGWAKSVSAKKLSVLPVDVFAASDKENALRVCDILDNGGLLMEASGIDSDGKEIPDCLGIKEREDKKREAEALTQPLFLICTDYEYGYMDRFGKVVIPCKYDEAHDFSEGMAMVKLKNKIYYIDKKGEVLFSVKADDAGDFHDGMAWVYDAEENEYGYLSSDGKLAIPLRYSTAGDFHEGLANIGAGTLINKKGREVLDIFEKSSSKQRYLSEGCIADFKESSNKHFGFYRFLNSAGVPVVDYDSYGEAGDFHEGLVRVYHNTEKHWGFIDKRGTAIVPFDKYTKLGDFHEGLARFEQYVTGSKYPFRIGYLDNRGKEVVNFSYSEDAYVYKDNLGDFHDGLAKFRSPENGKFGYLDKTGKESIPIKYEYAEDFRDGLTKVELNGKFGYIDKDGREVTDFIYDVTDSHEELSRSTAKLESGAPIPTSYRYKNCTGETIYNCTFGCGGKELTTLSRFDDGDTIDLPQSCHIHLVGEVHTLGKQLVASDADLRDRKFKKLEVL